MKPMLSEMNPISSLINELRLFHLFCRSNYDATLFAILCIVIPSTICQLVDDIACLSIFARILRTLFGVALFIYQFDLSNQIHGVEEDRINKPNRPIPSNVISVDEAQRRWYSVSGGYILFGWFYGIHQYTLTWQILSYLNNSLNFSKNWMWKNFCMGPGTFIIVSIHFMLMNGKMYLSDYETQWCTFLSLVVLLNVHLQDYRDVDGDRKTGRKTFPMLFPIHISRRITSAIHALTAFSTWLFVDNGTAIGQVYCYMHFILFMVMAYRILQERGRRYDHITYEVLCIWFCLSLVFMIILIETNNVNSETTTS